MARIVVVKLEHKIFQQLDLSIQNRPSAFSISLGQRRSVLSEWNHPRNRVQPVLFFFFFLGALPMGLGVLTLQILLAPFSFHHNGVISHTQTSPQIHQFVHQTVMTKGPQMAISTTPVSTRKLRICLIA